LNQFEFEARGELDQNGEKRPESTAMIGRNKRCILYVVQDLTNSALDRIGACIDLIDATRYILN
jgi:hypothetical protein